MMDALKKAQGPVMNKETVLGIGTAAGPREVRSDTVGKGKGVARRGSKCRDPEAGKNCAPLQNRKETSTVGEDEKSERF